MKQVIHKSSPKSLRAFLALGLLIFTHAADSQDCTSKYSAALREIRGMDPQKEAVTKFCAGKQHFKALVGAEYLLLGVPKSFQDDNVVIEHVVYFDAIDCPKQHAYLEIQQQYVTRFNQAMVRCLADGNQCCPANPSLRRNGQRQ